MKILIDEKVEGRRTGRRVSIDAQVVSKTPKHLWVRLPDGNVIKRKFSRDVEV